MPRKLSQVIAVKKGVKQRNYGEATKIYQSFEKADLFSGFVKIFQKKNEQGEEFPPEKKKVQVSAGDALERLKVLMAEVWDNEATIDYANCEARANVELDGVVLVENAPSTHLLFLEKTLQDLATSVAKVPTLSEDEDWELDTGSGLFKTPETQTHRTKKIQKPLVLYPATDKHPAQTQLITEDEIVGYWGTVKMSGALPAPAKQELLKRINRLKDAVKTAREKANEVPAPDVKVADKLLGYIFQG